MPKIEIRDDGTVHVPSFRKTGLSRKRQEAIVLKALELSVVRDHANAYRRLQRGLREELDSLLLKAAPTF